MPRYYECDGPGRTRVGKTVLRLFLSIFLSLYNDKPTLERGGSSSQRCIRSHLGCLHFYMAVRFHNIDREDVFPHLRHVDELTAPENKLSVQRTK